MTSSVRTKLSTDASTFIPGAGSHCPVNAKTYRQCALETLNTPGGVASHTFHIKFRADHGFPWKQQWADIGGLYELRDDGVGRWTEGGQMIYGTDEVVLRRIYSTQQPPAPLLMMTPEGLTIIPFLQYSLDGYEVRDSTKSAFQKIEIQGLNVRIEKLNNNNGKNNKNKKKNNTQNKKDTDNEVIKVKLTSTPWQVENEVTPWCSYKVAIQLVLHDYGTSLYSESKEISPTDLNVLFPYRDLKRELVWAKHYKEYAKQVDLKAVENLLREYADNKYDNLVKKVKADEKIKAGGFRPRDVKVIRISGVVQKLVDQPILQKLIDQPQNKSQSPDESTVKKLEKSPERIKMIHLRIADTNGNMKIVVVGGFGGEIHHVSGKFRMPKQKQNK